MGLFRGVLNKAVAVGKSLLGVTAGTIGTVKGALADLAKKAMDPLARRRFEQERSHYEDRQTEIDEEFLCIIEQVKRDGGLSPKARDRYDELERGLDEIAQKLGPREAGELAPDDYDVVVVDPKHKHRLEWHVGQTTDKFCPKCGLPMILQFPRDQVLDPHPRYFWGCTGYYLGRSDPMHCRNTESVTNDDFGTLLRRDNEALAMDRDEMIQKAFDHKYGQRIGEDLRELEGRAFPAYRCPIHGVGMVLKQKKKPEGRLDVWYLGCPSPMYGRLAALRPGSAVAHAIPPDNGHGCSQTVKLKTVAQVLAVRQIGTGDIF